jgi:hypothetical protein
METNSDIQRRIAYFRQKIEETKGSAEQAWAYISWTNLKEGYYSPNELIERSLEFGREFTIDSPYCKIKRGTEIGANVTIKNGSSIDGANVRVGEGTKLNNAVISGSNIEIGKNNEISGTIAPGNIKIGDNNTVRGLLGTNKGWLEIGDNNEILGLNIDVSAGGQIEIGNNNSLHKGLNINCYSPRHKIVIGNSNSLGRDGGGVISTAYRFSEKWFGPVLIGNHVETTRGAEILGFSLLGWPLIDQENEKAKELFTDDKISFDELYGFFDAVQHRGLPAKNEDRRGVSFFGIVKSKLCCLTGSVTAKDDTRIQSSYLRNVIIQERCKVYFSRIDYDASPEPLRIDQQNIAIESRIITQDEDWKTYPSKTKTSGYPETAKKYFETHRNE